MATFSRRTTATRTGARNTVLVTGVDGVVSSFTRKAALIAPAAAAATVTYAGKAAGMMRDLVPIDQGDVLDSITADRAPTTNGGQVYADAGPDPRANKAAFVARFLEAGTVKMAPRPFVGPTADRIVPEFQTAIARLAKS